MAHSGTGINHSTQLLQRKRLWRSMKRRKTLAIFAAIYYKIAVLLILDKGVFDVNFFFIFLVLLVLSYSRLFLHKRGGLDFQSNIFEAFGLTF